jgi:pyruvate dehydrogenase E1 component
VRAVLERNGLTFERPFARFSPDSAEGQFLAQRGERFRQGQDELLDQKRQNRDQARQRMEDAGGVPADLKLDMSNFPLVHTQQMWGQVAAKLIRIGTHGEGGDPIGGAGGAEKGLSEFEQQWRPAAEWFLTLSPDVGTSTNIAPTMNARIYGPQDEERPLPRFEARHPELVPSEKRHAHHLRFEIAEANAMSALGSLGKLGDYLGLPFVPVMTVYDFFIKRALDQLYYNLYWGSEFILLGTPSGVTLAPEGAQHSWKSDIQIPNLVTWEPFYAVELEWVLCDAIARQMEERNQGRSGVLVRCVTRAISQKPLLEHLRSQARFKANLPADVQLAPKGAANNWSGGEDESQYAPLPDEAILTAIRKDCLAGAYTLIDWRGYLGFEPGDNVVHLFSMGSPTTEAIEASKALLELGIFAQVHVVTSPELLLGILGEKDAYRHLKEGLGISGDLQLLPEALPADGPGAEADWIGLAGRRVPIVAVLDGEAGLLDNIGSIVGVKQVTLATRRFSKCGRPDQVYAYHGLDAQSIVEAAGRVLSETALEGVQVSRSLAQALAGRGSASPRPHWRELWPGARPPEGAGGH